MIEHDLDCKGCLPRYTTGIILPITARCKRCSGVIHDVGSVHVVEGLRPLCWRCADILARARNEQGIAFALV